MSEYVIKTEKEIKSCYGCPFCSANDDLDSEDYRSMYCSYPNMGEFVTDYEACRHPNCPLKELPEHGDLVEREDVLSCISKHIKYQAKQEEYMAQTALSMAYGEIKRDGKGIFEDSLVLIPTILEASKED